MALPIWKPAYAAKSPIVTLAIIFNPALLSDPLSSNCIDSRARVENVVYPPNIPIAMKCLKWFISVDFVRDQPMNAPSKSEPVTFTRNVPVYVLPIRETDNLVTLNRSTVPIAPPTATKIQIIIRSLYFLGA